MLRLFLPVLRALGVGLPTRALAGCPSETTPSTDDTTGGSSSVLSAWDETGDRVAMTTLNGAGQSFDSYFSYSWAQDLFFVNDGASLSWRGYDVF